MIDYTDYDLTDTNEYGITSMQGLIGKKKGELFNAEDMTGWLGFTFTDEESANKFIANFPKYCKARPSKISYHKDGKLGYKAGASIEIRNFTNGTTGEFNETAQKRQDKATEILKKLGLFE